MIYRNVNVASKQSLKAICQKMLLSIAFLVFATAGVAQTMVPVTWGDKVGVTVTNDGYLKRGNGNSFTAGAASLNMLASGVNGSMEVTVLSTDKNMMVGFTAGQNTTESYQEIDHAFYMYNGSLQVYENGSYRGNFGAFAVGDVLKIERNVSTVSYKKNGVQVYSSNALNAGSSWFVDAALATAYGELGVVNVSFNNTDRLSIEATYQDAPNGNDGSIDLTISGGQPNYVPSWSDNGSSSEDRTGLSAGHYSVTVTDAGGQTATKSFHIKHFQDVTWGDKQGITVLQPSKNLKKGRGTNYSTGAASLDELASGEDGAIEFTILDKSTVFMIGFTIGQNTTEHYNEIDHAFFSTGNNYFCYENGSYVGNFSPSANGDVIRIERRGNEVYYLVNGDILFIRPAGNTVSPWFIDLSLATSEGEIGAVKSSFTNTDRLSVEYTTTDTDNSSTGAINLTVDGGNGGYSYSWSDGLSGQNPTGLSDGTYTVTVSDNSGNSNTKDIRVNGFNSVSWGDKEGTTVVNEKLKKIAPGAIWNAGAASLNVLPANTDGTIEFELENTSYAFMIGLNSNTNEGVEYGEIDYAFYVNNSVLFIFENGGSAGSLGNIATGDVLKIERKGSELRYYINDDVVRYWTSVPTNVPYFIDASLHSVNAEMPEVKATFNNTDRLSVTGVVTSGTSNNGVINLTINGGTGSYTYQWDHGPSTQNLTDLSSGTYTVTVTDQGTGSVQKTFQVWNFGNVGWSDQVGVDVTSSTGLKKQNGLANGYNSGAISTQVLDEGVDGAFEITIHDNIDKFIGFNAGPNEGLSYPEMEYSFRVYGAGAYIYYGNAAQVLFSGMTIGDRLRIERIGTDVNFYVNDYWVRTASNVFAGEWFVDVALRDASGEINPIKASFAGVQPLTASASVTHDSGGGNGQITATATGGFPTYNYSWSNGMTGPTIANLSPGAYTLTVTDDESGMYKETYYVFNEFNVEWSDLTGVQTISGGFEKNAADGSWNAEAISSNVLEPGIDGAIFYTIPSGITEQVLGFDVDLSTSTHMDDLEYAYHFWTDGTVDLRSNNTLLLSAVACSVGDQLAIRRVGAKVEYLKNEKVIYTSEVVVHSDWKIAGLLYSNPGQMTQVKASFTDIKLNETLTHAENGGAGSIALAPTGGSESYIYSWSDGSAAPSVSGLTSGTYSVTVSDGGGKLASKEFHVYDINDVVWKEKAGIQGADDFVRADESGWGNSGVRSTKILPEGEDGYIQAEIHQITLGHHARFGWVDHGTNHFNLNGYLYGINLNANKFQYVIGENNYDLTNVQVGDIVAMARKGSKVHYYLNGVLVGTQECTVNSTWKIQASLSYAHTDLRVKNLKHDHSVEPLDIAFSVVHPEGTSLGSIDATISGGIGDYDQEWNTGEQTEDLSEVTAGTYTLTAWDDQGDTVSKSVKVYLMKGLEWASAREVWEANGNFHSTLAGWGNAGGHTTYELLPDEDGYFEVEVNQIWMGHEYSIGFVESDADNFSSSNYLYALNKRVAQFRSEDTDGKLSIANIMIGDKIGMARIDNEIIYYHNNREVKRVTIPSQVNKNWKLQATWSYNHADLMIKNCKHSLTNKGLNIEFDVTHLENGNWGSVDAIVSGGTENYQLEWENNFDKPSRTDLMSGTYTLTVNDGVSTVTESVDVYEIKNAEWELLKNIVVAGNDIYARQSGWDESGAFSNHILEKTKDGYFEVEIHQNMLGHQVNFGFVEADVTEISNDNYIYGISTRTNQFYYHEPTGNTSMVNVKVGDKVGMARKANEIVYYLNNKEIRRVTMTNSVDKAWKLQANFAYSHTDLRIKNPRYSFDDVLLDVELNITHIEEGVPASVTAIVEGGDGNYTINWSNGQSGPTTNVSYTGDLTVTIEDGAGHLIHRTTPIFNMNDVELDVELDIHEDGDEYYAATNGWGNNGGMSAQILVPGEDGYFEYEVSNVTIGYRLNIGFVEEELSDPSQSAYLYSIEQYVNHISYQEGMMGTGDIATMEDVKMGDKVGLARIGNSIIYYLNGRPLRSVTMSQPATKDWKVLFMFSHANGLWRFRNIKCGFGTETAQQLVEWQTLYNMYETNGAIKSYSHDLDWTATDAASYNRLPANESGSFEFTVPQNDIAILAGFVEGKNKSLEYTEIDYGLYFNSSGNFEIYKNGVSQFIGGEYLAGDRFKIARHQDKIRFYQNGFYLTELTQGVPTDMIIDVTIQGYDVGLENFRATFDAPLSLRFEESPAALDGQLGTLRVIPVGGTNSYEYLWNEGSTGPNLNNISPGVYTVTVTDLNSGKQVTGSFDFKDKFSSNLWENTENVNTVNASISSSGGSGWRDAGATSIHKIPEGADGGMEFIVHADDVHKMIGWSKGAHTGYSYDGIEYGIYFLPDEKFWIVEGGETRYQYGQFGEGDRFMIKRENGIINYYQKRLNNEVVLIFSQNQNTGGELYGEAAFMSNTGSFAYIYVYMDLEPLTVSYEVQHVTDQSLGAVDLYVSGGTRPYVYSWSNTVFTKHRSDLSPGQYQVTVTDALNNQAQMSLDVYQLNNLHFDNIYDVDFINDEYIGTGVGWNGSMGNSVVIASTENIWIEYKVTSVGADCALGLIDVNEDVDGASPEVLGRSVYQHTDNQFYIGEAGIASPVPENLIGTYKVGDILAMEMRGNDFRYFKNGKLMKEETNVSLSAGLNITAAISGVGTKMSGFRTSTTDVVLQLATMDLGVIAGSQYTVDGNSTAFSTGGIESISLGKLTADKTVEISLPASAERSAMDLTIVMGVGGLVKEIDATFDYNGSPLTIDFSDYVENNRGVITFKKELASLQNQVAPPPPIGLNLEDGIVLSPNGDGLADELKMVGAVPSDDFNLTVVDENGTQMFSTSDVMTGWNGTLPDASPAPEGQYTYYLLYDGEQSAGQFLIQY